MEVESNQTLDTERRRSSVYANQGQWRASDGPNDRRASSLSSLENTRISLSNGEPSNDATGSYQQTRRRRESSQASNTSRVGDAIELSSSESEEIKSPVSEPSKDGTSIKRRESSGPHSSEPSEKKQNGTSTTLELPPLAPTNSEKNKRFGSLFSGVNKPTVPSKLRSMIRRSSSNLKDEVIGNPNEKPQKEIQDIIPSPPGHHSSIEITSPGRSRIFTIDQVRRSSFLPINRIKSEESGGSSSRRSSVRLSEADVGLILGKVSKISPDTLRQAAIEGNTSLCEALVRGAVDINDVDINGKHALILAVENGKSDTTDHLITLGANIELKDEDGKTALYYGVAGRKTSCVKVLLIAGADPNIVCDGCTIFDAALKKLEASLLLQDETERKSTYLQTCEICRLIVKENLRPTLEFDREVAKPSIIFLVDEWSRAKNDGEELIVPPIEKVANNETILIAFLKQHRKRVKVLATIKIYFVVLFIGFDLAMRERVMTPGRLATYVFLYIGAYYL